MNIDERTEPMGGGDPCADGALQVTGSLELLRAFAACFPAMAELS